jgi:hypothetical protein
MRKRNKVVGRERDKRRGWSSSDEFERNEKQGPWFGLIGKIMLNYQLVLLNFHQLPQNVVCDP